MGYQPTYHAGVEFGTAAGHLATSVPFARVGETVGEIRLMLLGQRYESAEEIVVKDGRRLLGLVRMEDLLAAQQETAIEAIMDTDPPVVSPGLDEEVVAWKAVQHGEGSLAVVDQDGSFLGLVPPSRMLGVLLKAHDEDVARFGGFIAGAEAARGAIQEALGRRLKHRLPWLIIGLIGSPRG
jgi:magnesium transporter